jgi:hypothetical protein
VALLSLPGFELVRVVSVAQVLLRTHLHHPVQNTGLNTIHSGDMCCIAQSVVRVVGVAQVLLRAHLCYPVQNTGLNIS